METVKAGDTVPPTQIVWADGGTLMIGSSIVIILPVAVVATEQPVLLLKVITQ